MVLRNNVDDKTIINEPDVRIIFKGNQKSSFDLLSRNVFMMKYSKSRMSALFSQFIITTGLLIKFCSPFNDLVDSFRSFFHHDLHDMFIAKSIASDQCILNMFCETVIFHVIHHGHATLCIFSIGFISCGFGNDGYSLIGTSLRYFQCEG